MSEVKVRVPWPPSVNTIWRKSKYGRIYKSDAGKTYQARVAREIRTQTRAEFGLARLAVDIKAHPPETYRKRDLDNLCKALLDTLKISGLFCDDEQIDRLVVVREARMAAGFCDVTIQAIRPVTNQETLKFGGGNG